MLERCVGHVLQLERGSASVVSLSDATNLIIGFALLVLLILLVQELSGSKSRRK
jgi:hypothetical protein